MYVRRKLHLRFINKARIVGRGKHGILVAELEG
jgi:hypothetical protein